MNKTSEIFGGSLPASNLTLLSTAAAGTSDYISFKTGSQVEALKIDTSGNVRLLKPLVPNSSDGAALGSASLMWSDLFLASGGVINWNNGDVTATHSANTLAFAGASSGYSFDADTSVTGALSATTSVTGATVAGAMVATQANQETGTATNLIVSPGRQHFHPGHAKLHFRADMAGNIVGSSGVDYYNMTSVTDTGTGIIDCTIATDFANTNYNIVVGTVNSGLANFVNYLDTASGFTAGTFRMRGVNSASAAAVDTGHYAAVGFGDLA